MRYGVSVAATGGAPWVMAGYRLGDGMHLHYSPIIRDVKTTLSDDTMHFVVFSNF